MSQITIEAIEKILKEVPNATYKQAKEALIANDGDAEDAIMELKIKLKKDKVEIKDQVIDLVKKSTVVRLMIERNGRTLINLPMAVGVVGAIIGPMAMLAGLSAAVLSKSKIKIANDEMEIDLGEFTEEKFSLIKDIVAGKIKETKTTNIKKDNSTQIEEDEVEEIVIDLNKKDK